MNEKLNKCFGPGFLREDKSVLCEWGVDEVGILV